MNRALHVWVAVVALCSVSVLGQSAPPLPYSPGDSRANPHLFSSREPDRVRLSEILISTPQPYDPDQLAEARHKAEELRDAIRGGSAFADVAKANSQGPSASLGGDLGYFKHGALAPSLDELVFRMKVGDVSDVLRTKQGFVVLQVTQRATLGAGAHGRQLGALDILSDIQGADFGPYLQRILQDVKTNWYLLIPESASMKKGKLAIEFAIAKDGKIVGMKLVASSGDVALDRPAWTSIVNSSPFPFLPSEFHGQYLALRFRFYYNPDKNDLQ
jgi:TonB family protein